MTTTQTPEEKADSRRMRAMFETIAPRYDFITKAFSFGMDMGWKRRLLNECGLGPGKRLLDLACGTGDFARMAQEGGATAIGADLTIGMMQHATFLPQAVCADAMRIPFADRSFDAVTIGYGVRNFSDLPLALKEVHRVLKPGGTLATLDFFLPENPVWRELFLGYMHTQGALWGALLHGKPAIYTYIPRSLRAFLTSEQYTAALQRAGLSKVQNVRYLLGGIQLHWARK
jgi:demethylmenaquinone methyltransferase/2-methoxy-6-polyprenyl-1,4-benzoquinol methylase